MKLDVNGDGEITEAEFMLQAVINESRISAKKIKIAKQHFRILDKDGSGTVNIFDFTQPLAE